MLLHTETNYVVQSESILYFEFNIFLYIIYIYYIIVISAFYVLCL